MDINGEIAEKIFGWAIMDHEKRLYREPGQPEGFLTNPPDFMLADNHLLREAMNSRGYELAVTHVPADFEMDVGQTYTAAFNRQNESFECTESDEMLAVCGAALKAYGVDEH